VLHFHPVDFETEKKTYSVEVTARRTDTNKTTKTITVTVTDLDDEAPTNIRINGPGVIDNFDSKGFISTLIDMIPDSNGEVYITNSSDGPLGFELITVDDFKIRAVVNGKSKGISSSISIWIGSTESCYGYRPRR
jgi:hypothetical protein